VKPLFPLGKKSGPSRRRLLAAGEDLFMPRPPTAGTGFVARPY